MNLCLRLLVSYWDYKQKNSVPKDPENNFNRFEIHMGIILNNLWQHTEALQTTDKYLLINYIGTVLKDVLASSKDLTSADRIEGYQPAMILSYLKSISCNVERLIASDIMPCIKENELLSNLILFLVQFHDLLVLFFIFLFLYFIREILTFVMVLKHYPILLKLKNSKWNLMNILLLMQRSL